jgi:hypothetical protein
MEHNMPKTLPNTTTKPAQTVQAKPHAHVLAAQAAFDACITRFTSEQINVGKARDSLNEANDAERGMRETLLCELAVAATAGDWSLDHAKMGVDAAIAAFDDTANDKKTVGTLRTFASECYRCIHPDAREHVKATFEQAHELWDAETAAAKTAKEAGESVETPLRDAFKRVYHMVVGSNGLLATRAAVDAKGKPDEARRELAEVPEMLAQALETDERRDHKRAARMIAKAVETIETIAGEFPSPRWDTVIQFLGGITPDKLVAYRDAQMRQSRMEQRERPAAKRSAATPASVTADAVNAAADEMME